MISARQLAIISTTTTYWVDYHVLGHFFQFTNDTEQLVFCSWEYDC